MGCCATTSPTATPNSGRLTYSTCSCWYAFSSLTFTTAINPLSWHATAKTFQFACVDRLALATHIVCICACSCEAFRDAAWDAPVSTSNIPQVASHMSMLLRLAPRGPCLGICADCWLLQTGLIAEDACLSSEPPKSEFSLNALGT